MDITVPYVLTTPGGTITFNDGSDDQFYLTAQDGLDGAPIRAPIDNAPQTDGGLVHDFYLGPRHVVLEGTLLILSTRIGNSIRAIRNAMTEDLIDAHESLRTQDGTLAWTPAGLAAHSLTVRGDVPVQVQYDDNHLTMAFVFGLVAADPDMT